jgi:FAD/FMN-containing dehydrogenase/Fe-S oxidoreductase
LTAVSKANAKAPGGEETARSLRRLLDGRLEGYLRTDEASRALWSTDASIYLRRPVAVAVVRSEGDVQNVLAAARELGVPVTPRGTATSLAGQATAPGIALDTSLMDRVLGVDLDARRCCVEPGVIQGDLNRLVKGHGLVFGADTSTSDVATLGGMVGNNSAGMRSLVYGTTADQILSLRCVLASGETVDLRPLPRAEAEGIARDGRDAEARLLRGALEIGERYRDEIRRRYPKLIRRVSGYGLDALVDPDTVDLTRLVCGSEGTLAVVTRVEFRLHPLPEARAMASFQFDSLAEMARATVEFLRMGPSAVELLDDVAIGRARATPAYRGSTRFIEGNPKAVLLVEWSGTEGELDRRFAGLEEIGREVGARKVVPLRSAGEMDLTVRLRKSTLPLLLGTTDRAKPVAFVEDAAVPPERLEEFVGRFEEIVEKNGTWACFYGHASVGTLHVRPALDTSDPEGVRRMRRIAEEVADLVAECGGSISGEHGDGLSRSEFLEKMYGPELVRAFGEVKRLFDPRGLLNPGVIVDPPRMETQLRIGPGRGRLPVRTGLDFSSQGGFASAVELCNGSGFCRKRSTGTMCPSYMVTFDEQDSTRARANMLRSVLDGTLPREELTGERMKEVFDLCVGCKACKSECPSQVDAASMKTEVLYQSGKEYGFSLRARAAGHVRKGLALAALAPALYNAAAGTGLARRAAALAGIDKRRELPRVTADGTFSRRFPTLPQGAGPAEVALFNDTWNEYQRPGIGEGAVRVFAAAGARVLLPKVVCCGRPMLSEGLVDTARENARRNVDLLWPLVERGVPLVGLEPSCILTIRDDYEKLLPDDGRVEEIAAATRLFEEAFLDLVGDGAEVPFVAAGGGVLLHGHCHQKALVGTGPTERALSLAGAEVEVVDSGCCGMAGLFGYEEGHYEVSMKMANRRLFPAVRKTSLEGSVVVAPGTSCREQVRDGTGRLALHPAEYLAARLE